MKYVLLLLSLLAAPAWTQAATYTLDPASSSVAFTAKAQGFDITGTLPVSIGMARVDLQDINASEIDVTVATDRVRTGVLLATAAIKGRDLLDTKTYPEIRFEVRRIMRRGQTAKVYGDLTVKSVTRPVALDARFVRTADAPGDSLNRLGVHLTGTVDRRDFNVLGYPALVHNTITITVLAWLDRIDG